MHARRPALLLLASLLGLAGCGSETSAPALDPALEAAIATYREDGAEHALPEFQRLAKDYAASGKRRDEAAAIHYIGESHWRLGDFDKSREFLDRALAMETELRYRHGMGKTLNSLGLLEWDSGNYDAAKARFRRAGMIARQVGDPKLEGASLNNLGLVHDELGDYRTSLAQYDQALEIYGEVDFPRGVGDTLGNIGGVHLLLGRYPEALDRYREALTISESLKSTPSMGQDHGNIALCLLGLGKVDESIEHFDKAIRLANEAGMRQDEAYWTRGKANALIQKGAYDQGLTLHKAALAIYEEVEAQAEAVEALHDMGLLYVLLGDLDSAEQNFERALAVAESIGLARGVTSNLIALGDLQFRQGHLATARESYDKASARATESGEKFLLTAATLRLSLVQREIKRFDEAAALAGRALESARAMPSPELQAEAHLAIAEIKRRRQQFAGSLESYAAAEDAIAAIGDPDLLWQVHFGRALAQKALGKRDAAEKSLIAAIEVIEGVRSRLKEQRFRAGYVQDKYDVYVELVRLQLELGRAADAFITAERLRARHYAEQLGGRSPAPLTADERQREDRLRGRIRQLQNALTEELAQDVPSSRQLAVTTMSQELVLAEQDYQSFLDDRLAAAPGNPLAGALPDVRAIQAKLRDDDALVEYVVGRDGVAAFVITPDRVSAKFLDVRRADLDARIELLRDLLSRPAGRRWLEPARNLSAALVEPLKAEGWLAGTRQLYLVPHGVLNYLPFSLLPDRHGGDEKLLIDSYSVAFLPTAAMLLREAGPAVMPKSLLAMAPSRSRLQHAPEEARTIDAMFRPHSRLLVGAQATESGFKSLAGDFAIVHLATHGRFNRLNPLMSGVELEADATEDGLLQVHEVLGLHLSADLVTLSACDTALGSGYFAEVPAGDELVGMTRAFLSAGSTSVMATLWEVDDLSSVRLMQRFYTHLNDAAAGADKALALARAQREFRASDQLAHPYYWAPFVMVGGVSYSKPTERAT
jgi:CHAT domain-containing protein/tetratricopeptide (TPR) repeat protein